MSAHTEKKQTIQVSLKAVTSSDDQDIENKEEIHAVGLPKSLKRKIDLRIMPFFMIAYFLQFLDKTLLNYAAVMGISDHLKGNEYSNLSTMFYVSFLACEPLAGFLIQKLPIAKYLAVNMVLWGAVVSCHAATKTYAGLMIIRTLLGVFEASTAACLIPIMGMYYTKAEQTRRTALWYMQVGIGQMAGSLLSFAFQHVHSTKLENWQILFIFMGIITSLLGVITYIFLPDNPMSCTFLTKEEKEKIVNHIRINQAGVENRTYKAYQVKEILLKDKQTWLLFVICALSNCVGGSVTTFSSTIIKSFGFTQTETTIMQLPAGFISAVTTVVACYVSSYTTDKKAYAAVCISVLSLVGLILQVGLNTSQKAGKLIGVYLMSMNGSTLAIIYAWGACNTSGYTKRLTRNTMTLMSFCLGNLLAPQHFRDTDAPNYIKAKIALIIETGVFTILLFILRVITVRENKVRDKEAENLPEDELHRDALFLDITDIENKNFRYDC